jgi:outer membrane protein assembly factor BamE (lipoprotein component of BamABCDE complex)
MKALSLTSLAGLVLLVGCATDPVILTTPIRSGMSKAELRAAYGSPVRVVSKADGSEDWYYTFGTQSHATQSISTHEQTVDGQTATVGEESATTTTSTEQPIRLSPAGRVTGRIPPGNVVRR